MREVAKAVHQTATKPPLRGRIESVDNKTLTGWIWNPERSSEPVGFSLIVNGTSVGRYVASRLRGDLARKNIGNGNHSFRIVLDDKWLVSGRNLFEIDVEPYGVSLAASFVVELANGSSRGGENGILLTVKDSPAPAKDPIVVRISSEAEHPSSEATLARVEAKPSTPEVKLTRVEARPSSPEAKRASVEAKPSSAKAAPSSPEAAPSSPGVSQVIIDVQAAELAAAEQSETYHSTLNSAKQKFLKSPLPDVFFHLKDKSDKSLLKFSGDERSLSLDFEQLNHWFRVVFLVPPVAVEQGKAIEFYLSVRGAQGACKSPSAFLMVFQKNGSFRSAHRFGKTLQIVEDEEFTRLRIRARQWAAIQRETTARGIPIFLALEFTATGACDLGALSVVVTDDEEGGGAFRRSTLPVAERLDQIVSSTHSAARVDQNLFLLNEAEIALRMECFTTAGALLDRTSIDAFSDLEQKRWYLQLFSEVKIAEGDMDALGAALNANWALTSSTPSLFTLASICAPAKPELSRVFARLPNNEWNYAYLSRLDFAADTFEAIKLIESGDFDRRYLLFAASQLRKTSTTLYRSLWNRYLAAFGLDPLKSLDPSVGNVLTSAEFVNPPQSALGPKVSVIMAAYNSESTISYAARSILNQSHSNVELLICDDCSTDGTLGRMFDALSDPRVRIFRSLGNQGTYNIRNALIERATGEFLTFQDADDFAHPDRLRRQVASLGETGIECVIGRWVRIRPDGEVAFFRDQRCLRMSVVSLLARRQAFLDAGKYHPVLCGADSDMFDRFRLQRGRFVEIEEPLILGLWSERSLTQQHGLEATEDGYRSKARRDFAEVSGRQRFLGADFVTHDEVADVAKAVGIYREPRGVHELSMGGRS